VKTFIISTLATLAIIAAPLTRAAEPSAADSVKKGIEWLISQQAEDGSFSNPQFPALTGLALWAIAESKDPQYKDVVKKASDFLISKIQPDGGIYVIIPGRTGGGLSTYNTSICLTALAATGRDDINKVILDARAFLASNQYLGDEGVFKGGFGYDKNTDRAYTDMMNTHFSIEAMRRTQHFEDLRPAGETKADANWDAALAFLDSMINDADSGAENAGGFYYAPNDPKAGTSTNEADKIILRSYGSITYAGLMSLLYCKVDKTDSRVRSALDWASKHWTLDENPGMGEQGLYFFYNVMSRSMSVYGDKNIPRKDAAPIEWAKEMTAKVVSLQAEDGSWTNKNGRFWENDPVLATAYSVLALIYAK